MLSGNNFSEEEDKKKSEMPWWQPAIVIFFRLSGWIIGPIILALIIGKWLDKKYNTEPWLFLLSVGVAFVFSMIGMARDTVREIKKIENENKKSGIQNPQ